MEKLADEIRRQPDAWEPWLVYADWLSEQGDPRGRLIGLEHRRETATFDADEQRRLKAEIAELVAAHEASWQIADPPEDWQFERRCGFVVGLSLPLDEANIARLDEFLHDPRASLLTTLRVNASREHDDADGEYDEAYEPPPVPEQLLRALFELQLGRIRALAFQYTPIGAAGVALLASWSGLAQLRALDLRYNYLADDSIEMLVGAGRLTGLQDLKLQRNRIGPPGARALAAAGRFDRLTHLNLRENPIGSVGAAALAGSANFRRLESLYLYRDDIGLAGARALADSEHLPIHIRRYWTGQWSAANEQASTG